MRCELESGRDTRLDLVLQVVVSSRVKEAQAREAFFQKPLLYITLNTKYTSALSQKINYAEACRQVPTVSLKNGKVSLRRSGRLGCRFVAF